MVATRPALEAEVNELKEICELYILSNPNYNKKIVATESKSE